MFVKLLLFVTKISSTSCLLESQNQVARGMSVIDSDLDEETEDSVSSGESLDAHA